MHLGRPGLGDKMFEKCEQSMPLSAISASPPESLSNERIGNRSSFDSILDNDRRSSMDDSIFDKTGQRSSVSSDSVFGDDEDHVPAFSDQLLLPHQYRPLSMVSLASLHSPMKEDDTMVSVSQLLLGHGDRNSSLYFLVPRRRWPCSTSICGCRVRGISVCTIREETQASHNAG